MMIGRKLDDRHEHVQDAEHPAADVLRQVFLELGLGRDGDERVGDAGDQRDDDDHREQRRDRREVEAARARPRSAGTG